MRTITVGFAASLAPDWREEEDQLAMTTSAPIRIVLAKVGLDGHDRGVKVVARALRDAGMQVIYAGLWQTPEAVGRTVGDEDAGWLGLGVPSGAPLTAGPPG